MGTEGFKSQVLTLRTWSPRSRCGHLCRPWTQLTLRGWPGICGPDSGLCPSAHRLAAGGECTSLECSELTTKTVMPLAPPPSPQNPAIVSQLDPSQLRCLRAGTGLTGGEGPEGLTLQSQGLAGCHSLSDPGKAPSSPNRSFPVSETGETCTPSLL